MGNNEFSRTELLLGSAGLERLKNSAVAVFGAGGVGSHCIEALARSGVGHLILIDSDKVAVSNINRQSMAYHSTVGQYKTEVLKRRVADICSDIRVTTREVFVLPENVGEALPETPDYIVDAIDTVSAKIAIIKLAKERDIPIISCMGTGNKLHAELFEITDISKTSVCPLCRVMRRELKGLGIDRLKVLYSKETPRRAVKESEDEPAQTGGGGAERIKKNSRPAPASISFVPPVAGLLIAGEVIRGLAGEN